MKFSPNDLLRLSHPDVGSFAVRSDDEAFAWCRSLARQHYENFPVGSLLIPRHLQPHFYSIYAFSRLADDIADELGNNNKEDKVAALSRLEKMLLGEEDCSQHPIFRALHCTMLEKNIPPTPLLKLLTAFRMDSDFRQAASWSDLEWYCQHSANPIGEVVLRLYGFYNDTRASLSDAVCTGLQLVNFWQDFSRDIPNERLFIPQDVLVQFALTAKDIHNFHQNHEKISLKIVQNQFLPCFNVLFEQTKSYFAHGAALLDTIPDTRLRAELALTIVGGTTILHAAHSLGFDILRKRPRLGVSMLPRLMVQAFRLFLR
jgi:squalene synthase HpnC